MHGFAGIRLIKVKKCPAADVPGAGPAIEYRPLHWEPILPSKRGGGPCYGLRSNQAVNDEALTIWSGAVAENIASKDLSFDKLELFSRTVVTTPSMRLRTPGTGRHANARSVGRSLFLLLLVCIGVVNICVVNIQHPHQLYLCVSIISCPGHGMMTCISFIANESVLIAQWSTNGTAETGY